MNISKARLEGAFVDELRRLQPTPGCMKLLKERVLQVWRDRKAEVHREAAEAKEQAEVIQKKLDRLDHAFIFAESIDEETYERQRDKLRVELTLAQIDRHAVDLEELDVEGILAFAEQLLPSAANVWVQASLDQKQRLQTLSFPEGVLFDGIRLSRTNLTSSAFRYLEASSEANAGMVSPEGIVPIRDEPQASCDVPEGFRAKPTRASASW